MHTGCSEGHASEQISLLHAEDASPEPRAITRGRGSTEAESVSTATAMRRIPVAWQLMSADSHQFQRPGLPHVARLGMIAAAVFASVVVYKQAMLSPAQHRGSGGDAVILQLTTRYADNGDDAEAAVDEHDDGVAWLFVETYQVFEQRPTISRSSVDSGKWDDVEDADGEGAEQSRVTRVDVRGRSSAHGICKELGCGKAFSSDSHCQCNADCHSFHDCCSDYAAVCEKESGSSHSQGSHEAMGGFSKEAPAPSSSPSRGCQLRTEGRCEAPRIMAHSGASAPLSCLCPPPLVPHKNESCNECHIPDRPQLMTFYMYRAQDDTSYPLENVNLADLAGVLWYLHSEVVGATPRKYKITRIMRFSVSIQTTQPFYDHFHKQFGPFVAYDGGSDHGRAEIWSNYGFVVGCQLIDTKQFNYVPLQGTSPACHPPDSVYCTSPKWYSLPGPCPEAPYKQKTEECKRDWPGGACGSAVVTGGRDCTYFAAPAGEISLNELEGIEDYQSFWISANKTTGDKTPNGNQEYDIKKDAGVGMDFWDGRHSLANCTRRMRHVLELFKKRYPDLPETLPEPPCT